VNPMELAIQGSQTKARGVSRSQRDEPKSLQFTRWQSRFARAVEIHSASRWESRESAIATAGKERARRIAAIKALECMSLF
jgi:hypothetical protein